MLLSSIVMGLLCVGAVSKEHGLRGSSAMMWIPLGGGPHNVADNEGQRVGQPVRGSLWECEEACNNRVDCKSFAFCGDTCYLKDRAVHKEDGYHFNQYCTTYYRGEQNEASCYELFSSMAFNNLVQSFPNNPDSMAKGFATCSLCTNGTLTCGTSLVYGGKTPLIASHIHLASDGDGENGSGDPVISFCGDNSNGLIQLDPAYPEMCAPYEGGSSNNAGMMGVFLNTPANSGMTVSERVRDIASNAGKYYMNFHSIASWAYWQSQGDGPKGMCRGVMQLS